MKIISLDLAYADTGYAVLEDDALIEFGVISTDAKQTDWERTGVLRERLIALFHEWGAIAASGQYARVAIEKTDWTRGARDNREAWIRETISREALAFGVATAFAVCREYGIEPVTLGPSEWHREVCASGKGAKDQVADYVTAIFSDRFEIGLKDATRDGKRSISRVVYEKPGRANGKRKQVPSHVTDAIGMGLVAFRRLQLESRMVKK